MSPVRLFRTPLSSPRRQSADTTPRRRGLQPPRHRPHPSRSGLSGHRRHRGCSRRRVVALLLAAGRGCGHHSRGDRVRRQADEEAPSDDGQRKAGGFGADESLLGRAQKESREVARRGRVRVRARPRGRCVPLIEKLARKRHASGDGEASTKNNGHASNVCFRSHHSSGAAAA